MPSPESQIDQMTQKVQKMEQSDLVEGYAWFMANPEESNKEPWMGCFVDGRYNDSDLNDLGKIYVNMSSFDTKKFYDSGELIQAKDYVNATTDDRQVKVRPNTEQGNRLPLQIELPRLGSHPDYQINVPWEDEYKITVRIKTSANASLWFWADNKKITEVTLPNTNDKWQNFKFYVTLSKGKHTAWLYNGGASSIFINSWKFEATSDGIEGVKANGNNGITAYSLDGTKRGSGKGIQDMHLTKGIYVVSQPNGEQRKILVK